MSNRASEKRTSLAGVGSSSSKRLHKDDSNPSPHDQHNTSSSSSRHQHSTSSQPNNNTSQTSKHANTSKSSSSKPKATETAPKHGKNSSRPSLSTPVVDQGNGTTIHHAPPLYKNNIDMEKEDGELQESTPSSSQAPLVVDEEAQDNPVNDNQQEQQQQSKDDGFTTVERRRSTAKSPQKQQPELITTEDKVLPAIKLTISDTVTSSYSSSVAIAKEIDRCMGSKLNIKFASLKGNLLIIATDDQVTHARLTTTWPSDAFSKGVRPVIKPPKDMVRTAIIQGVEKSVSLDDEYVLQQLNDQHATNPTRIFNHKTSKLTSLIKIAVTDQASYKKMLASGIRIGYRSYKVEPERKVLQCYKCQGVGHSAFHCSKNQVCLKCGGEHKHSECTSTELKCANCGDAHAACSRSCPHLKNHTPKPSPVAKPAETPAPPITDEPAPSVPTPATSKPAAPKPKSYSRATASHQKPISSPAGQMSQELNDFIMKVITAKMAEMFSSIKEQIEQTIAKAVTSLFASQMTKQFEPQLGRLAASLAANPASLSAPIAGSQPAAQLNSNVEHRTNYA